MLTQGLYPAITLPTRLTDNSATLIDNVFTNINGNSQFLSVILISNMSDHFPYFYSFKYNNDFKADKAR